MKTCKKFLAVLLCVLMIGSLAACGSASNPVLGAWSWEINLSDKMGDALSEMNLDALPENELIIYANFVFGEDGVFTLSFDQSATAASAEAYLGELVDIMVEYMYGVGEKNNMSREDFDAFCEKQYGASTKEYIQSMVDDSFDVDSIVSGLDVQDTYYYKVDGDKIYVADEKEGVIGSDEYITFSVTDSTMTIYSFPDEILDEDTLETLDVTLPITLIKK